MINKFFAQVRKLVGSEHYVMVIRSHNDGVFIVNKSYFGGEKPLRLFWRNQTTWQQSLVERVFLKKAAMVRVTAVPSKGLSYKTIMLVCDTPARWSMEHASHLQKDVVALSFVEGQKPQHARLISKACKRADDIIAAENITQAA